MDEIRLDEDWIRRRSWDLPTSLMDLRMTLGGSDGPVGSDGLLRFLALPAAEPMPVGLLREVVRFIEAAGGVVPLFVWDRLEVAASAT